MSEEEDPKILNGRSVMVQRVIRRAYQYLSTAPPPEFRITIQPDSQFAWLMKAITIAIGEELLGNTLIEEAPDMITFSGTPLPTDRPPIPDDPDAEENL